MNLSTFPRIKIGAVIVDRSGDVIGVGVNKQKSHPLQAKYNHHRGMDSEDVPHWTHAEMDALIKAKRHDLQDASVYVYRENRAGTHGMCRPCKACMAALIDAGVKKIFYTTEHGFAFEEIIA